MAPEFASLAAVAEGIVGEFGAELRAADAVLVRDAVWDDFAAVRQVAPQAVRVAIVCGDEPVTVNLPPESTLGGHAVFVDAGVVTGRTAAAVARAARKAGVASVALVVGVLPRDTQHALAGAFTGVAGLVTPLGHRDLRWHIAGID